MKKPKEEADGPEEVGRVAALDDGESTPQTCLEAQREGGKKGVQVLNEKRCARSARTHTVGT